MVVHENIGVDAAAGAVLVNREEQEVFLEVCGILEDALFLVTARNDMIEGAGIFNARFAGHMVRVANRPMVAISHVLSLTQDVLTQDVPKRQR